MEPQYAVCSQRLAFWWRENDREQDILWRERRALRLQCWPMDIHPCSSRHLWSSTPKPQRQHWTTPLSTWLGNLKTCPTPASGDCKFDLSMNTCLALKLSHQNSMNICSQSSHFKDLQDKILLRYKFIIEDKNALSRFPSSKYRRPSSPFLLRI